MSHFALVAAVVLGFALTAAVCHLIVPIGKVLEPPPAVRQPELQPGPDQQEPQPKPTASVWGGLCLMLGTLAAVGIGWTAVCVEQPELLSSGGTMLSRLLTGIFGAFAFGTIGLLDDLARIRSRSVLGLRLGPRLLLEAAASTVVLAMLAAESAVPMGAVLPGGGYISFGLWAPVLWTVILVSLAECARVAEDADGLAGMAAFMAMLGLILLETRFGVFPLAVLPGSIAGALVALLVWSFPPAKLRTGRSGSLFLAGAIGCIPLSMGSAELSLPLALPFWLEGGMVFLQILSVRLAGRPLFSAAPLHRWLEKHGVGPTAVLFIMSVFGACGLALTMRAMRWY